MNYTFYILMGFMLSSSVYAQNKNSNNLYPRLSGYINKCISKSNTIPYERKKTLNELANQLNRSAVNQETIHLLFICTHNSRRSQLCQIWGNTAIAYYNLTDIYCYSGGTEVTAFNDNALNALVHAGFNISKSSKKPLEMAQQSILSTGSLTKINSNPIYEARFSDSSSAELLFSKKYTHPVNPQEKFYAIMTCSQADSECPFIEGASSRISLPYEDPKIFDGTKNESKIYQLRSQQIAVEMFYLFSLLK